MKFVLEKHEIKCSLHGSAGPLIFLLHGYGGGPLDWHHLLPLMQERCRLVVPNLTPLFACEKPLKFSKQVQLISSLVNQINQKGENFLVIGSSYGATLSFGVRAHFKSLVKGHAMINPMPLDPLAHLRSASLRMLFGLNMVPGALPVFLKTKMGKELLAELGNVFGLGINGRRELGGMSERKRSLVTKAVQRFAWIAQHESWAYWATQLKDHVVPLMILASPDDPLFTEKEFRSYQLLVPMSEFHCLSGGGHVAVRSHHDELSKVLTEFISHLDGNEPSRPDTLRRAI